LVNPALCITCSAVAPRGGSDDKEQLLSLYLAGCRKRRMNKALSCPFCRGFVLHFSTSASLIVLCSSGIFVFFLLYVFSCLFLFGCQVKVVDWKVKSPIHYALMETLTSIHPLFRWRRFKINLAVTHLGGLAAWANDILASHWYINNACRVCGAGVQSFQGARLSGAVSDGSSAGV